MENIKIYMNISDYAICRTKKIAFECTCGPNQSCNIVHFHSFHKSHAACSKEWHF
jgi:hypothetical protein